MSFRPSALAARAAAVDYVAEVATRRIPIVIDDLSPAAQMIPDLKSRRIKVARSTARDMAKGCCLFESRRKAGTLTHRAQDSLTEAVLGRRNAPSETPADGAGTAGTPTA